MALVAMMAMSVSAFAETPPALLSADHKLVDTIWDVHQHRKVARDELIARLQSADYILLGEKHDNISHHRHEAWLIGRLGTRAINTGVAFEMIDSAQGAALDKKRFEDADALIDSLGPQPSGWQYRVFYRSVFQAVLNAGLRLYPANLPRQTVRAISTQGLRQAPRAVRRLLQAAPLSDKQLDSLRGEIREAHCNLLGDKMLPAMMNVQRARDATMAHSLLVNRRVNGKMVLVAGAGHVRADRGVPHYLHQQAPRANLLTLAWIEVQDGVDAIEGYTRRWDTSELPFDIVWFTPRADRGDPCAQLRQRFKHTAPATPD
jgi:uncharacterized iron-regulated protein